MKRRRKWLIAAIVVFIPIVYLTYTGFTGAATYYYTVSEVMSKQSSLYGQNIRVNGEVAPGTVETDGLNLKFTIAEGGTNLPVVYKGAVPDSFKAGTQITIEGSLSQPGVFQATNLMPKCPSKYAPAT